jgi:ABC-type transporter Mla MlaB component
MVGLMVDLMADQMASM